jgi:putative redox protein
MSQKSSKNAPLPRHGGFLLFLPKSLSHKSIAQNMKITLQRSNQAVRFEGSNAAGNTVTVEGSPDIGGEGLGVRPMELLLMSLAACTSMDVVSILAKMRQPLDDLRVEVEGTRATDEVPAVFKKIHLHFRLQGALRPDRVEEALRLSVTKYCSVGRMLEKTAEITYDWELAAASG